MYDPLGKPNDATQQKHNGEWSNKPVSTHSNNAERLDMIWACTGH